jgi:hypothetical protein
LIRFVFDREPLPADRNPLVGVPQLNPGRPNISGARWIMVLGGACDDLSPQPDAFLR